MGQLAGQCRLDQGRINLVVAADRLIQSLSNTSVSSVAYFVRVNQFPSTDRNLV